MFIALHQEIAVLDTGSCVAMAETTEGEISWFPQFNDNTEFGGSFLLT